jgi:hypothetical protein
VRVTRVDGTVVVAQAVAVAANGRELQIDGQPIALHDVRWLEPAADLTETPSPLPHPVQIWLNGGRVVVADAATAGEQVRLVRPTGEPWTLPFERLRAAWWGGSAPPAAFTEALSQPVAERDRLVLMVNGAPTVIEGFLESLNTDDVRIEWMDEVRTVPRTVCVGFVAATTERSAEPPRFNVRLKDGSALPATGWTWTADDMPRLVVRIADGIEWRMVWSDVARIDVATDRLRFLSDLKPVQVMEDTIVALPRPWQADRSVTGRPLIVGGQQEAKGLGVQSGTRLVFDINGLDAAQFAADVSLDPVTGRKGDCEFVVRGDGRELWRQRVRGADPPVSVQVAVEGVSRLELAVEFGENLDLGDHANWGDARLIRAIP